VGRILWVLGAMTASATSALATERGAAQAAGILAVEPYDDDAVVAKGLEDGVEIKVTLDPSRVPDLLDALSLADAQGGTRDIWFYDTPHLDLFDAGLVLRARVKNEEKADATVKARPVERRSVAASWFELAGFKCEEDRVAERRVPSCSLTRDQPGRAVRAAASGAPPVRDLFSKEQARFFAEFGGRRVGWEPLVPLGPIPSLAWKVRTRFFDAPLVVEVWRFDGDDAAILELSVRAPAQAADGVAAQLDAYLADLGFEPQPLQQAKTRTALARLAIRRQTAHTR
jgi:hypothetical protein